MKTNFHYLKKLTLSKDAALCCWNNTSCKRQNKTTRVGS